MTANRVYLESSALTAVAFSPESSILQVEFRNGLIYEYLDVSRTITSVAWQADKVEETLGGEDVH